MSTNANGAVPAPRARVDDTALIKALAAILVANSHVEHFYPHAWMAGDGLLGNSLFFFLAGFGLVRSNMLRRRSFPEWMWRRIVRIYPTMILVVAVFAFAVGGGWRAWSPLDYAATFIWPTLYTFVQLVMPFYIVFYVLLARRSRSVFTWAMVAAGAAYVVFYVPDALHTPPNDTLHLSSRPYFAHVSAYFQVMLMGAWIGASPMRRATPKHWIALALASVMYFVAKLAMVEGYFARDYIVLHALTFAWCVLTFVCLRDLDVIAWLRARPALWRGAMFVGGLTLEIYVVHTFLAGYEWLYSIRFPFNLVLFWVLTLSGAWMTWRLVSSIQNRLRRRVEETPEALTTPEPALGASIAPS